MFRIQFNCSQLGQRTHMIKKGFTNCCQMVGCPRRKLVTSTRYRTNFRVIRVQGSPVDGQHHLLYDHVYTYRLFFSCSSLILRENPSINPDKDTKVTYEGRCRRRTVHQYCMCNTSTLGRGTGDFDPTSCWRCRGSSKYHLSSALSKVE